ncbi:uncharacterized protein J3D65DRAFT_129602 [Phyllosticta citribraziliensis]|uniref:Uncharacterized protein n=1 Tax=Phyllosticta citribraziliensis TaxID=989973 RepID=A0ABR1L5S6_9PEZI
MNHRVGKQRSPANGLQRPSPSLQKISTTTHPRCLELLWHGLPCHYITQNTKKRHPDAVQGRKKKPRRGWDSNPQSSPNTLWELSVAGKRRLTIRPPRRFMEKVPTYSVYGYLFLIWKSWDPHCTLTELFAIPLAHTEISFPSCGVTNGLQLWVDKQLLDLKLTSACFRTRGEAPPSSRPSANRQRPANALDPERALHCVPRLTSRGKIAFPPLDCSFFCFNCGSSGAFDHGADACGDLM